MTILVTGATGLVGGEVARALLAAGAVVRAGVRDPEGRNQKEAAALRQLGAQVVALDYAQPATFAAALDGVSKVFYLTLPGPEDDAREPGFVAAMQQAGVAHVVKLSVWEAADEAYLFARVHRQSEKRLEQSAMAWTFLRPTGFMQNLLQMAGSIRATGSFALPMGQAALGHIDVRDIADVAARVLLEPGHHGRAYELSGPEALTYEQVAAALTAGCGRPVRYVAVSPEQWRAMMQGYGAPAPLVEGLLDLYGYYVSGGSSAVSPAVAEILGRPARTLLDFIAQHRDALGGSA
jgi:uncharacterized protein YbjT (DUF2867 family)